MAFYQLGNLQRSLGQWSQALCAHLEACRLDPEQSDYHLNLGVTYQGLQQPDQAIHAYERAYEKDNKPKIRFNRAQALLQSGRYAEGWLEYEWRLRMPEYQDIFNWHNVERRWRGQPFPGQTLVVYHEQGLGDAIQFCRYIPYLKALGGTVIFAVKDSLVRLMETLHGPDRIVEHCEETYKTLRFHWAVPLLSLPNFCRTTLDSLPNQTPYLNVTPEYRDKWQQLLAPYLSTVVGKKIGLVSACNPESNTYTQRSCPLPLWQKPVYLAEHHLVQPAKRRACQGSTSARRLPTQSDRLDRAHRRFCRHRRPAGTAGSADLDRHFSGASGRRFRQSRLDVAAVR